MKHQQGCRVLIKALTSRYGRAVFMVPEACQDVADSIPPTTRREELWEVVGVMENLDPDFTGITWFREGVTPAEAVVVEVCVGVCCTLIKGVVPAQCVVRGSELVGCTYGLQRVRVDCLCRKAPVSVPVSKEVLQRVVKTVLSEAYAFRAENPYAIAWALAGGDVFSWLITREP